MKRNSWLIVGLVAIIMLALSGFSTTAPAANANPVSPKFDTSVSYVLEGTPSYLEWFIDWGRPTNTNQSITRLEIHGNPQREIRYSVKSTQAQGEGTVSISTTWLTIEVPTETAPNELVLWDDAFRLRMETSAQPQCSWFRAGLMAAWVGNWLLTGSSFYNGSTQRLWLTSDEGQTWKEVPSKTPGEIPAAARSGKGEFFLERVYSPNPCALVKWRPMVGSD